MFTALITPFEKDGSIDKSNLFKLIDNQINAGVDGIVILGTTAESPTLSSSEQKDIIEISVKYINKRCEVIVGTGSNSTSETIQKSLHAQEVGVDGLLIVNPYYNKPTQKGLFEHFTAIADAVETPIILYNILGRTSVNIETPTLIKLSKHKNIVAVKEASGNLQQIKEVIAAVPVGFTVLSGDDALTIELMKLGGHGVVSVVGNILPFEMVKLVKACSENNQEKAQKINDSLKILFNAAFIETNPQPIKTMMAKDKLCQEIFRLPLTTMENENKVKVLNIWDEWKLKHNK